MRVRSVELRLELVISPNLAVDPRVLVRPMSWQVRELSAAPRREPAIRLKSAMALGQRARQIRQHQTAHPVPTAMRVPTMIRAHPAHALELIPWVATTAIPAPQTVAVQAAVACIRM